VTGVLTDVFCSSGAHLRGFSTFSAPVIFEFEAKMDSKKLSIPEIVERYPAEWGALSQQQRSFVEACVTGGIADDKNAAVAACLKAYPKLMLNGDPKKRLKRIKVWTGRLLNNKRVKKIISLHRGLSDLEILCEDVQALVKRSRRKNAHQDVLLAPWLRVVVALETIAADNPRFKVIQ
jgi:hypothetical protein